MVSITNNNSPQLDLCCVFGIHQDVGIILTPRENILINTAAWMSDKSLSFVDGAIIRTSHES